MKKLFLDDLKLILHLDHIFLFFLKRVKLLFEILQLKVPSFISFLKFIKFILDVSDLIFHIEFFLFKKLQFSGFRQFQVLKFVLYLRLTLLKQFLFVSELFSLVKLKLLFVLVELRPLLVKLLCFSFKLFKIQLFLFFEWFLFFLEVF